MIARGELRHHAAVGAVQLDLAVELVRQEAALRVQHGGGALVAGGFDGEHAHAANFTAVDTGGRARLRPAGPIKVQPNGRQATLTRC